MVGTVAIPSDNPIELPEDDALGRYNSASVFADQVLSCDSKSGLVVGLLGQWGSGKTSFLNLAAIRFVEQDVPVLTFNPWMFSGAEQLVASFFIELAAQLKLRPGLAGIADDLEDYGEGFSGLIWLPLVGPWIERGRGVGKLLTKMLQRRKEGVGARRDKLRKALVELGKPIVVVIDDIDRLSTNEIRDVFKLVRLTANFPNVIYVLAFDRRRVEDALDDQGISGRDYLEKILQVAVDLPAVQPDVLNRQVFGAIDAVFDGIDNIGPFDQDAWPDVYMEVIRPLLRNMRDVRRYAVAVHGTVRELAGQVEQVDVLGLEAIRVFLPHVFAELHSSINGLTSTHNGFGSRDDPRLQAQVERLVETAGAHAEVVRSMIRRMFLAGSRHVGGMSYGGDWKRRWLRDRRVAHEDILRLYLERVAGEGLQAFSDTERAWPLMADRDALNDFLRSLSVERLGDVISGLEAYEDQFEPQHVVPSIVVLLNLLPELPERDRGMFSFGPRTVVTHVTYRLLCKLPDKPAVEAAVREILPHVETLSSKLELIDDIGHQEGRGHKLATESGAAAFERAWRDEVRNATVPQLVSESELLRVLLVAKRESGRGEDAVVLDDSTELTLAVLGSARTDVRSQSVDSRAVHRSARLAWDVLVELFESEDTLRARVAKLRQADQADAEELLELFDLYATGWRPDGV